MPLTGLEPVRFIQPRDFKSLVSAYSTTAAYKFARKNIAIFYHHIIITYLILFVNINILFFY